MKNKLNEVVMYLTLVVGIVTIVWFIRDVRKQNSKELKNQTEILFEIQKSSVEIQKSSVEIQKSGERQAKILERIQESSERIHESSERQIKILEKIVTK